MPDNESTGFIRIIKVPDGEAPLWVRQAWLGLTLPCGPIVGVAEGQELGTVTRQETERKRSGFSVFQDEALAILAERNLKAFEWWTSHDYPLIGECFCFAEDEAEIVGGVTHQQIVEVTEEMMGNPDR
jgi:hypothetical protein